MVAPVKKGMAHLYRHQRKNSINVYLSTGMTIKVKMPGNPLKWRIFGPALSIRRPGDFRPRYFLFMLRSSSSHPVYFSGFFVFHPHSPTPPP
jgi:hypothetical protein